MTHCDLRKFLCLLTALLGLCLAGCGDRRDNAQRLGDALANIEQQNYRAAEVDLKNVLRDEPDNVAARMALGQAAFNQGDYATAEQAWQRARELGADGDDYALPLARALLERNAYVELLAELTPNLISDPDDADLLRGYRAQATLALGSIAEASAMFDALDDDTKAPAVRHVALLGKATIARSENAPERAEKLVRQSLALEPDSAKAQLFLGQLLLQRRDLEQAEQAFSYGLTELQPRATERMLMMAGQVEALLGLGRLEDAHAAAERLAGVGIGHPMIGYLQGRVAIQRGEAGRAIQILQESVSRYPGFTPASELLGAAYLTIGEAEQAEMLLSSVLGAEPGNAAARRMLARARYMLDRPVEAAATLNEGLRGAPDDPEMLNMLARLSVREGDPARAVELLERARRNAPDDVQTALALAAAYVSADRRDDAVALVNATLPDDNPDDALRKQAMLLLVRHDYDAPEKSLPAIRELRAIRPNDADLLSMTAILFNVAGASSEARADIERVVALRPDDPAPLLQLGAIDEKAGDFSGSKPLLLNFLRSHPEHENVLLALSRIAELQGDYAASQDFLERAHAAHPTSLRANLALASRALLENRLDEARGFASAAAAAHPDSGQAQVLLGNIDLRRGDSQQALVSLARATALEPGEASWRLLRARAEMAAGRDEEARVSLKAAQRSAPGYLPAVRELALLEIRMGNRMAVEPLLDSVADHQDRVALLDLTGDVRAAQKRPQDAARAYADSFAIAPSRTLASKYYRVSRAAADPQPDALLRRWLEREPRDGEARTFLASQLQIQGDRAGAIREYELALEAQPGNVNALNNLAWLLFESSEGSAGGRAVALAEQAHRLAPERPDIADTYGWLLTETGRVEEGREVLRRALGKSAPGAMPDVAYHLAAALERSGKRDAARELLQSALTQAGDFYSRRDAQALFDRL